MSEFFSRIKVGLIQRISIVFLVAQVAVVICLYLMFKSAYGSNALYPFLTFVILELLALLFMLFMIRQFLRVKLGSREAISRTLFQNTRNIINNISHEYRTPLNAIMGFADELYQKETDPAKKEALAAVRLNSERLFAMSKKLIDFSSIETGLYVIDKQYHSAGSLLANLKIKYEESLVRKNLEFRIIDNISERLNILFDYHALFEILSMLVENSVKFTKNGTVTVESSYEKGTLIYKVSDSGVGIPDEKKSLVFELYRQGTSDLDREYEGVGMGLTIAGKLAEMHGGSIAVSDNEPAGTVFQVTLKCPSREVDMNDNQKDNPVIPPELNDEQKEYLMKSALELQDYVKVFDQGKIKTNALELVERDPLFRGLSERLIETAGSFDETEFAAIVEKMLEVSRK